MEDCLFCRVMAGVVPTTVDEDELTVTSMDVNPGSEGHALVVPRARARDLLDIRPADLVACTLAAQRVARRRRRPRRRWCDLINCCGAVAWQTLLHVHLHVVPRYADAERDRLHVPWVPTPGDPDAIDRAGAALRSGLG